MASSAVLIIKLGALGDFVQALGPLKAIRDHHPDARITLLTTAPYEELARVSGYVDDIWLDERPRFLQIGKWLRLRNRLLAGQFQRVYDLQTSDRSSFYYRLFVGASKPEWSGIARVCSHPHDNPDRDSMHTQDRQREQLAMAGIKAVPATDLSWAVADLSQFSLPDAFGLLVPGGAAHRPDKRWPIENYGHLAAELVARGITPVVLGTAAETDLARTIKNVAPETIDLTGKTRLLEIAALSAKARVAIGNDTGPMHMAAMAGCPSVVLFSKTSDPALCAPRGEQTAIVQQDNLSDLTVGAVLNLPLFCDID